MPTSPLPTVSLHSSAPLDLLEDAKTVLTALRETRRKMQWAFPHGRDYNASAHVEAVDVAREELRALGEMIERWDAFAESVANQRNELIQNGAGWCK